MFYLFCGFCRWTTREAGLPDQPVATGSWPESENPHANRIAALLEHYRSLAQLDKFEKEQKRQLKRRSNYLSFTADKYSLSALAARKRSGLPFSGSLVKKEIPQIYTVEPAVASEELDDELDPEIFSKALDLSSVTTIEQRIRQPERQPTAIKDVMPIHKFLSVRRSQRCRHCEHNLSKPEYNPSSVKFKLHLGAFNLIPDVMIYRASRTDTQLRLCNRNQYATHVRLLTLTNFIAIAETRARDLEASASSQNPTGRCRAAAAERSDSPTGTRRSRRVRTDGAAESQRRPEVCSVEAGQQSCFIDAAAVARPTRGHLGVRRGPS